VNTLYEEGCGLGGRSDLGSACGVDCLVCLVGWFVGWFDCLVGFSGCVSCCGHGIGNNGWKFSNGVDNKMSMPLLISHATESLCS
jgi:hypothetical protein